MYVYNSNEILLVEASGETKCGYKEENLNPQVRLHAVE